MRILQVIGFSVLLLGPLVCFADDTVSRCASGREAGNP